MPLLSQPPVAPPALSPPASMPPEVVNPLTSPDPPAKPSVAPFLLSKSSPPVPGKLVARIQALQFVEMRELLPDNIALAERMVTLPQQSFIRSPGFQVVQREVASINSWACAFATYIAILSVAHPSLVVSRLAYMRNIIREASRFGGDGWRTYDYVFRSQAAADSSMDWASTNPSLLLAYMQNSAPSTKLPCPLCHETDHQSQSCALAPLIPPSTQPPASQWAPKRPHYASQQPSSQLPSRLPDGSQLCVSWNQGGCIAMGRCRYKHVCGSCGETHIARDCSQTPEDSIFKRQPKRPASFRPSI